VEKLLVLDRGQEVWTDGKSIFIREGILFVTPSNDEAHEILSEVYTVYHKKCIGLE